MSEVVWVQGRDEFNDSVNANGKVIALFTAPSWCGPCRVQEPHYIRAAEAAPDITFVAIDIDDNDWALGDFGIKGVPVAFVYENGTQIRSLKVPQAAIPLLADIKG